MILEEFGMYGMSFGTTVIELIALYFVVKWGVKNGIDDYYKEKEYCAEKEEEQEERQEEQQEEREIGLEME